MIGDYDASEFTGFMQRYMQEHPEVVRDQRRGWSIHWSPRTAEPEPPDAPRSGLRDER